MDRSNVAMRARRTIPIDADEDDDTFVTCSSKVSKDEHSLRSSTHQRSVSSRNSSSGSRRHRSSGKIDRHMKKQSITEPRRPKGSSSQHSRQSYDSRASSYADAMASAASDASHSSTNSDQRKDKNNPQQHGTMRSRRSAGSKTPSSTRNNKLTIGPHCGMGSSRSFVGGNHGSTAPQIGVVLPDLFTMGQTFSRGGGRNDTSEHKRKTSNLNATPVAWKTPFEVDAPREGISEMYHADSQTVYSEVSEPTVTDPRMSEEQDAWAGIDSLLETKSLDDSFDFSTRDILPSNVVRAMRREDDTSVMIDDDASEYSEMTYQLPMKKKGSRKPRQVSAMPHLVEASDQDEDSDNRMGGAGATGGNGTLFDIFHWSEKDNVDGEKEQKKKLNSRKVQLKTSSNHSESDNVSLPSLATCREDELSTRSEISDWRSLGGSVVTEDLRAMQIDRTNRLGAGNMMAQITPGFAVPQSIDASNAEILLSAQRANGVPSLGGRLVLDKSVDEYIRKMQKQLPTISENGASTGRGRCVGFLAEIDENRSIDDSSRLDELPTLAELSNHGKRTIDADLALSQSSRKKEEKEKRDPTKTLWSSLKGFRATKTPKASSRGIVNGDEEKYFPDADNKEGSKRFSASRCLLNVVDED